MRLRLRFTKEGKVRFTSHRDVARLLERMARRAQLPLAYSQGFSPRPRVHFGLALPTGCASAGEYVDMDLEEPVPLDGLCELLSSHLPPGMAITAVAEVPRSTPSLQEAVMTCTWTLELSGVDAQAAQAAVDRVLASDTIFATRRRKGVEVDVDVRPAVQAITVETFEQGCALRMELATRPQGARPSDLLTTLDATWEPTCIRREQQWIESDGERHEPLTPGATERPHAQARAS